jgi:hypothetical protein
MNTFHFALPARMATPLAITHVTVVPMDSYRLLTNQTVIIEDGWITALDSSNSIDTTGMAVVDGLGKYLLPGLADMHIHYWTPGEFALFLANGVTLVRNMSGAPFHLAMQQQIQRGELPGPYLITTSPIIDKATPTLPTWYSVDDPEHASEFVQQCAERGYQQIKVLNGLTTEVLRAIGRASVATGLRMTGHCPNVMTFEEAMDAGMTCFEHFTGIWRGHLESSVNLPPLPNLALDVVELAAHRMDFDAIRRLANKMAVQQIWNCPTLVAMQFMYEPQTENLANPVLQSSIKHVPQLAMQVWAELDPSRGFINSLYSYAQWRDTIHARNETFAHIVAILHEEGVPLLIGTDTSVRFVVQGFSLHQELANFVAAGLSPYAAIRCATCEAARFLEQFDLWGTVQVGKRADLILVRTNPLDDVRALRNLEAVFVNGFFLTRAELDTLLAQQASLSSLFPPCSLPDTTLDNTTQQGHIVDSGTLIERIDYRDRGKITYRHQVLPNGEWFIEERYAFEQGNIFSIGGGRRRATQLILNPNFTLRQGTVIEESFVGTTRSEIVWTNKGTYMIRRVDEDNYEKQTTLGDQPLLPDLTLAVTVLPLFLVHTETISNEAVRAACYVDESGADIVALRFSAINVQDESDTTQTRQWQVSIDNPNEFTDYTYELGPDGQILNITCGKRTFIPA